jgi:hypothetical protein
MEQPHGQHVNGRQYMTKLPLLIAAGLSALLFATPADAHHHARASHKAARAYVHGYVEGYARATADYRAHARFHVRRKVVRLAPGPSYYHGQIDPWWRRHGHH